MDRVKLEREIEQSIQTIKQKAGGKNVLTLVSGGVDSMVTTALLRKALPAENIYVIHVNHGFMRKNESDTIYRNLKGMGFANLLCVNAEEDFLISLEGVTDPEQKRNIIGNTFIDVARKAAESFNLNFDETFLAQGTLRPDLLESGNSELTESENKVKTHHNDVDIIREARKKGLIVETNCEWYKEDVRNVARILGLDEATASRQPFPGPGLAVRIICTGNVEPVQLPDVNEFNIRIAPVKSVGVDGEKRTYKKLAALSGGNVSGISEVTDCIFKKYSDINRCVYVLNKKTLGELHSDTIYLTRENINVLREADDIVTKNITGADQYFAVLLPMYQDVSKKYSVVIRAVKTTDYMTVTPIVPDDTVIQKIICEMNQALPQVDLIMLDVTPKPPATIEWE